MLWGVNEPKTRATMSARYSPRLQRNKAMIKTIKAGEKALQKAKANRLPEAQHDVDLSAFAKSQDWKPTTAEQAKLAAEFSRVLREWLTPDEMEIVIARNERETRRSCCHSHDFCDANMAMDEAFTTVMARDMDLQSEADVDLWNRAWDRAKEMNFDHELLAAYAETF